MNTPEVDPLVLATAQAASKQIEDLQAEVARLTTALREAQEEVAKGTR